MMRKLLAIPIALAMLLPPVLTALFALSTLTTLTMLTRPPGPKVVLSYPFTDDQGKAQQATVVITGGKDLPDLPPEVVQMLAEGQLRANLSFFQGPKDDKLGEVRIEAVLPLEEIMRSIFSEQLEKLEQGFGDGGPGAPPRR